MVLSRCYHIALVNTIFWPLGGPFMNPKKMGWIDKNRCENFSFRDLIIQQLSAHNTQHGPSIFLGLKSGLLELLAQLPLG